MTLNKDFLAPCGLYCGVCGVYIATRDNNSGFMERLLGVYRSAMTGLERLTIEDLACDGCRGTKKSVFCSACAIRDCVEAKGYEGCHQCADFPCRHIDEFPVPVGKRVILRAIPYWREHGTERWVRDEEARYHCPSCGGALFRGAKRCRACKAPVDVD